MSDLNRSTTIDEALASVDPTNHNLELMTRMAEGMTFSHVFARPLMASKVEMPLKSLRDAMVYAEALSFFGKPVPFDRRRGGITTSSHEFSDGARAIYRFDRDLLIIEVKHDLTRTLWERLINRITRRQYPNRPPYHYVLERDDASGKFCLSPTLKVHSALSY